jgi:hypothetical protein
MTGRQGRWIAALILMAALAGFLAARLRASPPTPAATAPPAAPAATTVPEFVNGSRAIAAAALADSAGLPLHLALVGLARQWIGRPYAAFSLDRGPGERLRIDLTRFDCVLFVEQLLALVQSREAAQAPPARDGVDGVDGEAAALARFGEHVRRLRYAEGRVDYCNRQHYFSLWAAAAERQGYLVNLTPFLPGARTWTRRLDFLSRHAGLYEPMRQPRLRACIAERERNLSVRLAYLPLQQLPQALGSLRSGDIFGLVTRVPGLDVTHVGLIEVSDGRVNALHAAPGAGVIRSPDLVRYAQAVEDVVGVMVLRPMPRDPAAKAPGPPPSATVPR